MAGALAGKTVLVTGASGGFGTYFAKLLSAHGARVALAARRLGALEALKAEIEAGGGAAFAVGMDVTEEAAIVSAVTAIETDFGGIDVLVNNSGVSGSSPALDCTSENWDHVFDTNLRGAFLVAREVGRAMRAGGRPGNIVNVASIVGLRTASALSTYAASKAGLIHLTRALGLELARYDIRVNAIAPGYYPTDMNADFWETEGGRAMVKRIPMRRLGELRDLDGPMLLLASDASRYMTGAVIPVDGGHLCSAL